MSKRGFYYIGPFFLKIVAKKLGNVIFFTDNNN